MVPENKQIPEIYNKPEPDCNNFSIFDLVVDSLSDAISGGRSIILDILESEEYEAVKEIGSDISGLKNLISYVRKVASIPDILYMRKVKRYCKGISTISPHSREKFARKIGKKSINKDSIYVLDILNRTEDEMKIDIFAELFKHKVYENIDDMTYRRMMTLVDHTLYHDIVYMDSHIQEEHIKISTPEEESLLAAGWLIYYAPTWGSFSPKGGKSYKYTSTAVKFCELISGVLIKSD